MASRKRTWTDYPGVFFVEVPRKGGAGTEKVYYIMYRRDGKQVEEKAGHQYKDDMTPARASRLRGERMEGGQSNEERREAKRAEASKPTIDRLWAMYGEATADKATHREDGYRHNKYISPAFGDKTPEQLTTTDLDKFRDRLLKTLSPQTVKHILAQVRRVLNHAAKKRIIPAPSHLQFELPSVDNEKTETMTPEQMKLFLDSLGNEADQERELSQELQRRSGRTAQGIMVPMQVFEKRVMTTTTPASGPGSTIIPTDYRGDQFIDILRNRLAIGGLGATVLNGLSGNVEIPGLKESTTSGWVAENAALTPSGLAFRKVTMTPKHAGALTELSRNMLQQTSPDVEALVRTDFAAVLAEAIDKAAIVGGGTNEPLGILSTAGIGDVAIGTNGGALTWDKVLDLIAAVEDANVDTGGCAFLTSPKVVKLCRKTLKVASDAGAGFLMENRATLDGFRVATTPLVPSDLTKGTATSKCAALIFGKFSDLLIGYWSAFDLLVNPYEGNAYAKGNVLVRAMLTCDMTVRHPESFAAIRDVVVA